MDLLFILRDASGASAVSTLCAARDAHQAGRDVAVLVTQGALAALSSGSFEYPRALSGPPMRIGLAKAAAAQGLPTAGRGAAQLIDPKALVAEVAEAGVKLVACPLWSVLLGIAEDLPAGLEPAETEKLGEFVAKANQVIGSL